MHHFEAMKSSNVHFTFFRMGKILEGLLAGAVEAEVPHGVECLRDAKHIWERFGGVIDQLKHASFNSVLHAVEDLGHIIHDVANELEECKATVGTDLDKLREMSKAFTDPWYFIFHVEHDLIVNGQDIHHEIMDAEAQWENQHFYEFGHSVGLGLSKIFLGGKMKNEIPREHMPRREREHGYTYTPGHYADTMWEHSRHEPVYHANDEEVTAHHETVAHHDTTPHEVVHHEVVAEHHEPVHHEPVHRSEHEYTSHHEPVHQYEREHEYTTHHEPVHHYEHREYHSEEPHHFVEHESREYHHEEPRVIHEHPVHHEEPHFDHPHHFEHHQEEPHVEFEHEAHAGPVHHEHVAYVPHHEEHHYEHEFVHEPVHHYEHEYTTHHEPVHHEPIEHHYETAHHYYQ